jgi:hypothetical protein
MRYLQLNDCLQIPSLARSEFFAGLELPMGGGGGGWGQDSAAGGQICGPYESRISLFSKIFKF